MVFDARQYRRIQREFRFTFPPTMNFAMVLLPQATVQTPDVRAYAVHYCQEHGTAHVEITATESAIDAVVAWANAQEGVTAEPINN